MHHLQRSPCKRGIYARNLTVWTLTSDHARTLTVQSRQNVDCMITPERWLYDHAKTLTVWSHQNVDCTITPERWLYDHARSLTVRSRQNVDCMITLEHTSTVPQPVHITMLFPECRRSTRDTFCQDAVTLELAENRVSLFDLKSMIRMSQSKLHTTCGQVLIKNRLGRSFVRQTNIWPTNQLDAIWALAGCSIFAPRVYS